MISHVYIGVKDFDRSFPFYTEIFEVLDLHLKFVVQHEKWAAWHERDIPRPLIIVGEAHEGEASAGNGQMLALTASNRSIVKECYNKALELGGMSEGGPELRPHYHPDYFGAYFRDLDGNKLCVVCHEVEK